MIAGDADWKIGDGGVAAGAMLRPASEPSVHRTGAVSGVEHGDMVHRDQHPRDG